MSSDTPRTDAAYAAYFRPGATLYDLADEMKNLERELNDTNAIALQYAYEIDRLKEELEKHALTSSPALAQIDQLNLLIARLESALAQMEAKP